MTEAIRRRVRVYGDVQGVSFRYYCRAEAVERGVAGWVRNHPDGAVEAVFEGDAAAVEALCRWCEHGPSYARVERTEVASEQPTGERDFRITG